LVDHQEGKMSVAKNRMSVSYRIALILGLVLGLHHALLSAQAYPTKPVRVVVPTGAGTLSDSLARMVSSRISEALGQPFIVDNRPGAGGVIGAEVVAKSPRDGYTLLSTVNSTMVVNPFVYTKLSYDPLRDFEPISMLAKISEVLVVNPSLGIKTLEEFVRLAKLRPGQITYASGGSGNPQHLMMELFQRKAGIQLVHVPYKGAGAAMQALVSGEAGALNVGIGLARPHISSGKVLALAKTGQPSRDALPGVPELTTFYADAKYIPWLAVFAPKATPKAIVAKLNAEIGKALASSDIRTRLGNLNLSPIGGSPADLDQTLRADLAVNRELVKSIGLKLD
jgi:tripartite-type tricarboxylate transporter receptor subunit TctC